MSLRNGAWESYPENRVPTFIQMKAVIIKLPPRRAGREAVDSAAGLPPLERFKMFCRRGTLCREPIDSSAGTAATASLGRQRSESHG
jgi:hypothetical protein